MGKKMALDGLENRRSREKYKNPSARSSCAQTRWCNGNVLYHRVPTVRPGTGPVGGWNHSTKLTSSARKPLRQVSAASDYTSVLCLVCLSVAGIFGVITAGIAGDPSILYVKAVVDFPTVFVFASTIGVAVSFVCIPEGLLMLALYFLSSLIAPYLTFEAIGNVYACGGVVALSSALKIGKIQNFKTTNMIPALLLVVPVSALMEKFAF